MKSKTKTGLIVMALMTIACLLIILIMLKTNGGQKAVVSISGQVYGKYDLDKDQVVPIESSFGTNVLVIKDRKAYIESSDCPNKVCVDTGAISREFPSVIVCLPHELIVSLEDE